MHPHTFHIPVMGTGFTIDTPLKVARYGISSVISIVDDKLTEKIRRYYCGLYHEPYVPILGSDEDCRARRITEYLNLVDRIVQRQVEELKKSPFETGSEISKYFELMHDESDIKKKYLAMLQTESKDEKASLQAWLRSQIMAGAIDVNIMTKVDRKYYMDGHPLPPEYSDAMAALRGFAKSNLTSSVVLSAGLHLQLFGYLGEFDDFYAAPDREPKKKVILKVSDFRSAFTQAKILAKKGITVSEYRVESGLNCGGHAFPTTGYLLGPILEEFKRRKKEFLDLLFPIYREALIEKKRVPPARPFPIRITAQGGVGTSAEHQFLMRYYELQSVGWGSPFLLVPEATAVDDETLEKLAKADTDDIYLSDASPLGVPFYNLRNSASEEARRQRVELGRPGSPCLSKYLALNTEYGEPLCVASARYQDRKIRELKEKDLGESEFAGAYGRIVEKSCICRDLGDGALLKYGIRDEKKEPSPAVCPGPNLAYFSKVCALREMVHHIYGKINLIDPAVSRPHFLIDELKLYIHYLKDLVSRSCLEITQKEARYLSEFKQNLFEGIEYYRNLAEQIQEESKQSRKKFLEDLAFLTRDLESLVLSRQAAFAAG